MTISSNGRDMEWSHRKWMRAFENLLLDAFKKVAHVLLPLRFFHPISARPPLLPLAREFLRQGNIEKTHETYSKILSQNPRSYEAILEWGDFSIEIGNPKMALSIYQKGMKHYPDDPHLLFNMAICHEKLNDLKKSCVLLERVLELEPSSEITRFVLASHRGESPPRPPHSYIRSIFDPYAARFEHYLLKLLQYQSPQHLVTLLQKARPPRSKTSLSKTSLFDFKNVLDLGCGTGLMGHALKEAFSIRSLIGVDLSPPMLDQAREKKIYEELVHGELTTYLEYCENFDLITASDVLVYMGDLSDLFKKAFVALREDGLLCLNLEHHPDDARQFNQKISYQLMPTGRYQHGKNHVEQLAETHGFEVIDSEIKPMRNNQGVPVLGIHLLLAKRV